MASSKLRNYIDIGANLTDLMYTGVYHGTRNHFDDLQHVMNRSWDAGLSKIIITGGNLEDSKKALEMAQTDGNLIKFKCNVSLKYLLILRTLVLYCWLSSNKMR